MKLRSPNTVIIFLLLLTVQVHGQVGINTASPEASSIFEVISSNKGVLIPRVELQSTTDAVTIADPANSLLVFNTVAVSDVTVGYYYWSTPLLKWIKLIDQQDQVSKFGTLFTTFPDSKTSIQTRLTEPEANKVFNYAPVVNNTDNRYSSIAGASITGTNLTLPPGEYIVESSVYISSGSFDYMLRVNGVQKGLKGTMASVKTQVEIVQQKQIAVFTITANSIIDFIVVGSSGANTTTGLLQVVPSLSYLKITKL